MKNKSCVFSFLTVYQDNESRLCDFLPYNCLCVSVRARVCCMRAFVYLRQKFNGLRMCAK